jgi:hypothetical protein
VPSLFSAPPAREREREVQTDDRLWWEEVAAIKWAISCSRFRPFSSETNCPLSTSASQMNSVAPPFLPDQSTAIARIDLKSDDANPRCVAKLLVLSCSVPRSSPRCVATGTSALQGPSAFADPIARSRRSQRRRISIERPQHGLIPIRRSPSTAVRIARASWWQLVQQSICVR